MAPDPPSEIWDPKGPPEFLPHTQVKNKKKKKKISLQDS